MIPFHPVQEQSPYHSKQIVPYNDVFKSAVIAALEELQRHEHTLSDTRKPASAVMCEQYYDALLKKLENCQGALLVCLDEGQFAGFIAYALEQEDTLFEEDDSNCYALISDLCVLPAFRKKGLARLLFDAVFDALQQQGFKGRVRLCSLANNTLAAHAYQHYGFQPYEVIWEKKTHE